MSLFFLAHYSFSQNQNSKWYFGQNAGLDFMTNPPSILTNGAMSVLEGCASIANSSGNLLFYTDGATIWNQSHLVMANGTGLNGIGTPAQGSLIIKKPGSATLYYVFTLDGGFSNSGFFYSIVDMSLASGQGSVTVKNTQLYTASCFEKVTATRHCNGIDYWVVIREFSFPYNFRSYLLTSAGINSVATISPGSNVATGTGYFAGCMKISPGGKKLAFTNYHQTGNIQNGNNFELYDFNNTTGAISNSLALIPVSTQSILYGYGVEFSPDGTKLYGARMYNAFANVIGEIFQWNLCAGSNTAIVASLFSVDTQTNDPRCCSMQLAPNGKIYIARHGVSYLSVINNPNIAGSGCNFVSQGQSLSLAQSNLGLPNCFDYHPTPSPFTYTINNQVSCGTASFTPALSASTGSLCSTATYSLTNLIWNFGDPASGVNNTSTLNNPTHYYSNQGTYTAQLILYYSCGGGTDTLTQLVNIQPCITINSTSITCASLGSATVVTTGGIGPYSYTWTPSNQTNSVASGLSPGTYTITVFDAGNNSTYTTSTLFTSLIPLTGSLIATSSVNCNGASTGTAMVTNLAGGSGSETYLWINSSTSTTYTSPSPLLGAGIWSLTVTDALTGCQIKESFYISQPPPFNLMLSSSSPSTCLGGSVTLSGINSGGTPFLNGAAYTYSWIAGATNSVQVVSETLSGIKVYTLMSLDSLNCLTTQTIAVDFIANPVLTVADFSVCPLALGTLTVSGATSYTWASTTLSVTGITFTDIPTATQQYSVTGSALGCTSMATASIIIKPTPFPLLVENSPLCEGSNLNLSAYGGASYVWTGANGFNSTSQSNTLNQVSLNQAGVYNVTVTAANSCTASATKTIVVNPNPTVTASGATVCTSQTLNLNANSSATTFSWTGPQSFISSLQNPSIVNPVIGNTGTYTVKATSVFGCTNSAITSASVVPPPSLTVALSSPSLCSQAFNGSPNTITLTAAGANIYSIVTVPDMSIGNPGGPVSPLTAIPPNTGIASATLSGSNGVCTVTTGLTFSIIPNPTVTVSSPTPVICAGETYTYTNQGASSYTWSSATPGFTTYNNGGVAVANPSINSVFSVFGGSLGCNSASKTSSITVMPLPMIHLGPETPTVCTGSKLTLSAAGTANSYTWAPYASINSMYGNTVQAYPSSQQTYTVIGSLNSCTSTALITVSLVSLPNPSIQVLNPKACMNETITMQGFGGEYYKWNGPNAFSNEGQTIRFKAGSPFYAGIYTLTAIDKNNCQANTNTEITLYNLPSGNLKGKMEGCVPLHSEFNFSTNPDVEVIWELNQKLFTEKNFTKDFVIPGTYTIFGRYTDTLTQCKNTGSFVVSAYPLPIADFTYLPEKPIENLDQVIFTNKSTGEEQTNWNWYFINNKGYQSENKHTDYLFTEAGTYPVAMVVTNTWGCTDTVVKALKIEPDLAMYVPNVFTPNDDGLNDVFLPITRAIKFYELSIFNRWGAKIFSSSDIEKGWDGSYHGEPCKVDVYVWKINLSSVNGEMKTMTGQVTLSR